MGSAGSSTRGEGTPTHDTPKERLRRGQRPSLPCRRDHTYNILYGEGWREDVNLWGSRARYAETLNAVVEDREEVVVTRAGHEPVVTVALDDYESRKETAYLLRSPANARRLWESIERLEAGQGAPHRLHE
ncbi:MAG: type II toxin-antitoxin system prevent-host-death family antitoxin [Thermaerobacter sp.]|nr:type II toxin-antitoxin system prevent-host-death family antitoxin [Thermaerobacter sp.]